MQRARWIWISLVASLSASCGDDAPAFLPLDELCGALAEDICAAPKGCCKLLNEDKACLKRVDDACEAERRELVKEDGLSYDGVRAARLRNEQQEAVADCKATTPIAQFFEGGLAEGKSCERDSQCQSGSCDGQCVDGSGPFLCNDTESAPGTEP